MTARLSGASFPLAALTLGIATYLTVGLMTMNVPETATAPGPRFFPTLIVIVAYVVSALILIQSVRQLRRDRSAHDSPEAATSSAAPVGAGSTEAHADGAGSAGAGPTAAGDETAASADLGRTDWKLVGIVVGSFLAFILLLQILGWLLSAALLFFGVAVGLGAKNLLNTALTGLTMSALVQLAFSGALGVPLPTGFIGGF